MKTVLITGGRGFVGRNLVAHLGGMGGVKVAEGAEGVAILPYDLGDPETILSQGVTEADVIFHLAGVNRPPTEEEFREGNVGFTEQLCDRLTKSGRTPHIVFSSTIQAALDNPYGTSKRVAEESLHEWSRKTGGRVTVFRFTNLFGKWCRPNYNSVVATFCHNVAHDLPISVRDPAYELHLAYIDDVVASLRTAAETALDTDSTKDTANTKNTTSITLRYDVEDGEYRRVAEGVVPEHCVTLGELAEKIRFFHEMPHTYLIPDSADVFDQRLRSTYLSYLEPTDWEYGPVIHADARGNLAELLKSPHIGQIFVSRSHPGITRGNHYHHTKTEKFIVVAGTGLIRLRRIDDPENRVVEFTVRGEEYRIVDIPPGWTHSITNVGEDELVTLFHASEIFDRTHPDTFYLPVGE